MSSSIIRYDRACVIKDEDDHEFIQSLDHHLSYRIPGAEHSRAFKGYINDRGEEVSWDGRKHLMTSRGSFPPGLLPRVLSFYGQHHKLVDVIDRREPRSQGQPRDILPTLKSLGKVPRTYQELAVQTAKQHDRGIIKICTGGGKSLVATQLIAELGKPAIIYVIGKDLLYQMHDLFVKVFGEQTKIGIIGDGKCEIGQINVATIWSVGQALGLKKKKVALDEEDGDEKKIDPAKFRQIKEMLFACSVHIMDECHLASCDTVQTIVRNLKAEHVYGMSASPWRDDGSDLLIEGALGNRIVDISARELISQGYLVEPTIRFLTVPRPEKRLKRQYQTIYSKYIIENETRNSMVLKGAKKLVEQGYPTLVLFHAIKHGKILNEAISKELPVALLSGKDSSKKREQVKRDLEDGKLSCIIASKIFDIGIDLPSLSGLIVAGGGKSSVRALQRVGRVIRPFPGKTQSAVIDFADQAPYLMDHSMKRYEIYSQEFEAAWPDQRSGQMKHS